MTRLVLAYNWAVSPVGLLVWGGAFLVAGVVLVQPLLTGPGAIAACVGSIRLRGGK